MPGRCSCGWVLSATRSLPRTALPVTAAPPFSMLEVRVLEMETKHQAELAGARSEKEKLQRLVSRQSGTIEELQKSLLAASTNTSLLQRQQLQLLESVQRLVRLVSQGRGEQGWVGCALPSREGAGVQRQPLRSARVWVSSPQKRALCCIRGAGQLPGEGQRPDAVPSRGKSPGLGWRQPRHSPAASPSPRETAQKKEK